MIRSKLPLVGSTIFTTMSKMAVDFQAINLAQGFPNFAVDERLIEIIQKNLHGNFHQYAPMAGSPLLIEQICKLTLAQYHRTLLSTEVLITSGATQAIFTCIQALVHSKDEVIIIDPAYDCYDPAITLVGAMPVHVAMEVDFTIDWNKVEQLVNSKTKMLIVNNPHNPSGKIWNMNDLNAVSMILEKHPQLLLLSDEVYEYITFENAHLSTHRLTTFLDRLIVISSFGKTFHITGWKLGYLVAPENLMVEIKKVHQFLVFSVNHLAQQSLSEYLNEVDVNSLGAFYQEKRNYFRTLLEKSRFELLPSEGTYFQVVDYKQISSKSDIEFSKELVQKNGVAAIPMSVFYEQQAQQNLLRFCFAKDNFTLEQAAEKLCKI